MLYHPNVVKMEAIPRQKTEGQTVLTSYSWEYEEFLFSSLSFSEVFKIDAMTLCDIYASHNNNYNKKFKSSIREIEPVLLPMPV